MTDVGEKITLGPVSGFGGIPCHNQISLCSQAIGDINESYNSAHSFSFPEDRVRPILSGKTGPICTPEHFVFDVRVFPLSESLVDPALCVGIGTPVRPRVVD